MAQSAGLRQRRLSRDVNIKEEEDTTLPAFTPPNLTIKELLGAIPAHCFERSALHSSLYLLHDFIWVAALGYGASRIDANLSGLANHAAWFAYSVIQGMVCTGIWIIAHECGHQAYSTSKVINNTVGWFCHSALLVPYHSWRISHGKHHAATGHMTRDQVFVPKTRSQRKVAPDYPTQDTPADFKPMEEALEDAPLYVLANLIIQQLVGWPMYLITNASSQRNLKRRANHFEPSSPIFDPRHFYQIIWSDIGIALTIGALYYAGEVFGSWNVIRFYLFPYLWVNNWLVFITYLQHTDPNLPHYREGQWNFQRGALCTIDRNFMGPIGAWFWHGISETHVAHHICSRIPHYHAWEATECLKKVLGEHYMKSDENMLVSAYKSYSQCLFVEDEGDIVFYKNRQGKTQKRVVYQDAPSDSGIDVN